MSPRPDLQTMNWLDYLTKGAETAGSVYAQVKAADNPAPQPAPAMNLPTPQDSPNWIVPAIIAGAVLLVAVLFLKK